ncbi:beta-defensin 36-like [Tachyglossus aculeatus]|uniref:beta-defensin 36-like n=1 Tax=Tachyglossus aculeatus TaxID=9261 RepID=UPI0018F6680A|nr:beta-defensin 36-like [Tachyglossus aculeatus]
MRALAWISVSLLALAISPPGRCDLNPSRCWNAKGKCKDRCSGLENVMSLCRNQHLCCVPSKYTPLLSGRTPKPTPPRPE